VPGRFGRQAPARSLPEAARSAEVLALDVEDLDQANRQTYSELERSQIS
jgi:hypothetical protein